MTLKELRALLAQKHGALAPLKSKAMAAEGTQEDLEAFEAALKECEEIEQKIALLERSEALDAATSRPADVVAEGDDGATGERTEPRPKAAPLKIELDQKMSLVAASIIKAGKSGDPLKILANEGYEQFANELKSYAKAVNTTDQDEGGILVPTQLNGGIIPLLRAQSTFLAANPTRVQLVNGSFKQPRGATGATASYVAEGAAKPVSTPTFDAIDMKAKKLAGIVPLTNEARKWTVGNIEAYVRDDLRNALALTLDLNGYLGTGTGTSPAGIFNKAGIQTVAGSFADPVNPTLRELDRFATAMILKLTTVNIYANPRWRWVMAYRTLMYLADMRVGGTDGDLAFPSLQGENPTWKGFPVIVTNQIPTNLGTGTNGSLIGLVDFSHVLYGEEQGIVMKMSDQATLDPDGTGENLIHLFQQNMFAILAECEHDFGLRFSKAVVKATGIRWGA